MKEKYMEIDYKDSASPIPENSEADDLAIAPIILNDEVSVSSNGLSVDQKDSRFLANAWDPKAGKLIIYVDASKASLSCKAHIQIMVDSSRSILEAAITPIGSKDGFRPDALNSGCLGGSEGARRGVAIFDLTMAPETIHIVGYVFDNDKPATSDPALQGITVTFQRSYWKNTLQVSLRKDSPDKNELKPLGFEMLVIGRSFLKSDSPIFEHLSFVEAAQNITYSEDRQALSYELAFDFSILWSDLLQADLNMTFAREM